MGKYLLLGFCFLCWSFKCLSQKSRLQIDSMQVKLLGLKEDTTKVNLLIEIGNELGYTSQDSAIHYANNALEISNTLNFEYGKGRSLYLLASTAIEKGEYKKADSLLSLVDLIYTALDYKIGINSIYNARAMMAYMQGNYRTASELFLKAAANFDELRDTSKALAAYTNSLSVLSQTKQFEKAVQLSTRLLTIAELKGDSISVGYLLQGLVTNLLELKNLEKASDYMDRLKKTANSVGDMNLAAEMYSTIGTFYFRKNDFSNAEHYFDRSLNIARSLNYPYQIANHLNSLAQTHIKLNKIDLAKKELEEGLLLSISNGNKRAEANIAHSISSLYEKMGDYKKAFYYKTTHVNIYDSLLNAETRNYAIELETINETTTKEKEILRLNNLQLEKDRVIKIRTTYIIVSAILLAVSLLVFSLVWRNNKIKQKLIQEQSRLQEEKILAIQAKERVVSLQSMINGQESERNRIARDLHDSLGGLLSTVKMHYTAIPLETPQVKENPFFSKTLHLINNTSDELRKIAQNMMPEVLLKFGLVEALRDFCLQASNDKILKITLQSYGMEKRLPDSTEIMLFRIVQELVNNITKHAEATEAIIQLNRQDNRLSVLVEDNGKGFDTEEINRSKSMGMLTVKDRVDYLNGQLSIDSKKNIGTTIMIELLIND